MDTQKKGKKGTMVVMGVSAAYIIMGVILLAAPQIEPKYVGMCFSVLLLVCGIISIVRYFMLKSFTNIHDYTFSAGAVLILIGFVLLVKSDIVDMYFYNFMGACMLGTGVIKIQFSVDLFGLHYKNWWCFLTGSVAMLILSCVVFFTDYADGYHRSDNVFASVVLLIDGLVTIGFILFLTIQVSKAAKSFPEDFQPVSKRTDSFVKEEKSDTAENENTKKRIELRK